MIRHGKYEDISQLKSLWKQAFGDEDEYRDDFFLRVFRPEYLLCEECDGIITAMLYKIPCTVRTDNDEEEKAWYLYALATEMSRRGKGIMGRLIAAAKEEIHAQGDKLLFLIPAQQSLVGYYRRFQFLPVNKISSFYMKNRLEKIEGNHKSVRTADGETIFAASDKAGREAIFLEKSGFSPNECIHSAELMSRRWDYTNCSVSFPKEIQSFCLEWLLRESEERFYKIISYGETIGFLQGNIRNQVFHINYYGMSQPCWKAVECAAASEGFSGMQVLSFKNPDGASFFDTGREEGPPISVCAQQQVKAIHGVIPI